MAKIRAIFEFESRAAYPIDNLSLATQNLDSLLRGLLILNMSQNYETRYRIDMTPEAQSTMLACLSTDRKVIEEILSSLKLER